MYVVAYNKQALFFLSFIKINNALSRFKKLNEI